MSEKYLYILVLSHKEILISHPFNNSNNNASISKYCPQLHLTELVKYSLANHILCCLITG